MTEPLFTPPFPQPTRNKRTMLRRFFIGWHSWIHVLFEKSYTMKMGEVRGRGQLMYIANELPLVDRILKGGTEFPKHAELVKGLSPLIGNSVFSANGVDWENQRAMINPAFAHTAMNKTMPLMVEAVAAFLARIDGMDRRKAINIDAMMTHVAADIIFRTLFSQTLDTRRSFIIHQAFGRFQRYSHSASMLGLYGFPNRWFERWSERPANAIRGVFAPIVAERFNAFHAGQPAPHKYILQ